MWWTIITGGKAGLTDIFIIFYMQTLFFYKFRDRDGGWFYITEPLQNHLANHLVPSALNGDSELNSNRTFASFVLAPRTNEANVRCECWWLEQNV